MTWYRNAESMTYHLEAHNWVKSGKAVCGVSISHPAYMARSVETIAVSETIRNLGRRVCKSCRPMVSLHRVRINQGGYTPGGGYFGQGLPVYRWDAGDNYGWVRATDRDDARAQVAAKVDGARFYA